VSLLVEQLQGMCGNSLRVIGGVLCVVVGGQMKPLTKPAELFAWMHLFTTVRWSRSGITKEEFFAALHQLLPRYAWATPYPHYPPLPDVLYLSEPPAAPNTGALDVLLDRFAPASPVDRQLLKALVLTLFWGGPPGQRPLFTFTGPDGDCQRGRGVGKTSCVDLLARLVGGWHAIRPRAQNDDRLLTGLLSPLALPYRVAAVDNLKSLKFSNDLFESLVTATTINGHRLYTGHAERVNYLTWAVTVNGASYSKDLAQRSVVVQLARPQPSPTWSVDTTNFIDTHRDEIVADVRWHLEQPARQTTRPERWQHWAAEVVGRLIDPDAVLDLIADRRGEVDDDDQDADDIIEHVRACLEAEQPGLSPDVSVVLIRSVHVGNWLRRLKPQLGVHQAVAELKGLQSPRLIFRRTGKGRFFVWVGEQAPADSQEVTLTYQPGSGRQ
jgi:hypothetical protein